MIVISDRANSTESESLAHFDLSDDERKMQFPRNWPLGYEAADGTNGTPFWLDSAAEFHNSDELTELTRAMDSGALQPGLQVLCCWFFVRKVELVVSKGGLTKV
ncbi:hypothetical protein LINPERHAP2_LOCUS21825 [Linum perenne]